MVQKQQSACNGVLATSPRQEILALMDELDSHPKGLHHKTRQIYSVSLRSLLWRGERQRAYRLPARELTMVFAVTKAAILASLEE